MSPLPTPWDDRGYEEWVTTAGGLLLFLDNFFRAHPGLTTLELGSGNSTRVLARHCRQVVSIDIDPLGAAVPVAEQKAWAPEELDKVDLEPNVVFICGDILKLELAILREFEFQVIFFDLGISTEDKWLYRVAYDRLKANGILDHSHTLLIDNASSVPEFKNHLVAEGYTLQNGKGQCIAIPKEGHV